MSVHDCVTCGAGTSKYKCQQCKAPSCSLPCFKQHKSLCMAVSTSSRVQLDVRPQVTDSTSILLKHEFPHASVDALFLRHPGLKTQLNAIYESTLNQGSVDFELDGTANGASYKSNKYEACQQRRGWTPEKGFDRGMSMLRAALDSESENFAGLHEFLTIVMRQLGSSESTTV